MHDALFERYVELKVEHARIEAEIESLRDAVTAAVDDRGGRVRVEGGHLATSTRRRWQFSSTVEYLKEQLKDRKQSEKDHGTAQVVDEVRIVSAFLR